MNYKILNSDAEIKLYDITISEKNYDTKELNIENNQKITFPNRYINQYNKNDNLFWGIGLENETYLQGETKKFPGDIIISMLGRERYSVDYRQNYNMNDLKKIMSETYCSNKKYNISQMINSHSLNKIDRYCEHSTIYEKEPKENTKFSGKTVMEEWFEYDIEIKNKINPNSKTETNIFFDGDTIEFITENFYKTNSLDVVNELITIKEWFIEKFNNFKNNTNLWNDMGKINFVEKHPGLNIFKSMPNKIVFFNNSTIHVHLTLPTKIINGTIHDKELFKITHAKAIKLLQWFEPFFISTLGSPDIMQCIYEKYHGIKKNYFAKGSMRATISRYIGVGTYNTDNMLEGKQLTEPVNKFRPSGITWWRDMIKENLLYNLPQNDIGFDFNFSKHYQSGLEFRLLDGIPLTNLKNVLDIIILICEHSYYYETVVDIETCSESKSWNNIVYKSMVDGYQAKINKEEINDIVKILKIHYSLDEEEMLLEDFYYKILELLFDKYNDKETFALKYMTKDFNKINRWENFNKVQEAEHIKSLQSVQ